MEFHVSLSGRDDLSGEIYRQVRSAIAGGRLRPGDRLPPGRELARGLHVSRTTVTIAYGRLSAEGFVHSRVGAGTYVSDHAAADDNRAIRQRGVGVLRSRAIWAEISRPMSSALPALFDFRSGVPDTSLFPHEAWRRHVMSALRWESKSRWVYGEPAGHRGLREAVARHVGNSRGVTAAADDVTITSGTQQALDVVARVLLDAGDSVAVEDPGYLPPKRLFKSLGMRVHGVPVDREGLVVEALPGKARLVYVTPSHQYPLGVTMSLARRRALLAWAAAHDAAIIEDDYDSEFRFGGRPIEPLHILDDEGRVIYVGSFSKSMMPMLRLGFVVTPRSLSEAVHKAKHVADWHAPMLVQAALAGFISDGGFARHIRKARGVYQLRHKLITTKLAADFADHLELIPSAAGLHVTTVARAASADRIGDVVQCAMQAGIALHPLSMFCLEATAPTGLLFGYGAIDTADIVEGLRRLRSCFDG